MTDRAQLHNELEQLGAAATAAHDETWLGGVKERYSPEVLAANRAIEDRLVAAGHPREVAVEVVATWIVLGRSRSPEWSVLGCVDFYLEHLAPLQRARLQHADPDQHSGDLDQADDEPE